jgi:hypothetical protein
MLLSTPPLISTAICLERGFAGAHGDRLGGSSFRFHLPVMATTEFMLFYTQCGPQLSDPAGLTPSIIKQPPPHLQVPPLSRPAAKISNNTFIAAQRESIFLWRQVQVWVY